MHAPGQNQSALEKNRRFFADNDDYKSVQRDLEHYRLIALAAAESVAHAKSLLDIGNGGNFVFSIEHIPRVTAVDVFIEQSAAARHPTVRWLQLSALDLPFRAEFDTVTEVNVLHHVIGSDSRGTYANLDRFFQNAHAALAPGGRLVLLESTVPRWFLAPYKLIFPLLVRLWPLRHPPTFQFNYRDLLRTAGANGFELREFCWIPKTSAVLAFGRRMPPWLSPIATAKMIFVKP